MENKIASFLFKSTGVPTFEKFLDLSAYRHKLVGSNIANVSTPGYRSKQIEFHAEFRRLSDNSDHLAGNLTHPGHLPLGSHTDKAPDVDQVRVADGDVNSVDIEQEMSTLAQNELNYTVGATLLQRKFESLRKVINSR